MGRIESIGQWWAPLTGAERWILLSLMVLPYWSIPALVTMVAVLLRVSVVHRHALGQLLYRGGWIWLAGGMILSVASSQFPGESALQLFNFLPFFWLMAALAILIQRSPHPVLLLEQWALWTLLSTLPINLRAIVEYILKSPPQVARWGQVGWLQWLYNPTLEDYGHRADAVFSHPNFLANYLVIVLGLGLGLIITSFTRSQPKAKTIWVFLAMGLVLVGLFCTGSRNGLLMAGLLCLTTGVLLRSHRSVVLAGLAAGTAVVVGVFTFGVGGRTVLQAFETATLRTDVWQLALIQIQEHPWLGTGLGSFKLLYEPNTIPIYDYLHHAHNLPLTLGAELGLPLMVLFNGVVGFVVYRALRAVQTQKFSSTQRAVISCYFLAFAGCVLFTLFDLSFYDSRVNTMGWLALASLQAVPNIDPSQG